jgi:hypothetical protein
MICVLRAINKMSVAIKLHIKEGIVFKKKEILEMIKISSLEKI